MSTLLQVQPAEKKDMNAVAIERVLIGGDLSVLTPEQRVIYYRDVCASVGLNPLTKPFDYILLNGKLVLYAKRDATDQLRKINSVSVLGLSKELIEGVLIITAKGRDRTGREDTATGALHIAGLKAEALANAYMKCETKAKRRLTLSICGLGMVLDETEVETVPHTKVAEDAIIVGPVTPHANGEPAAEDGAYEPGTYGYMIDFGKWNRRSIEHVYNTEGPKALADYVQWLEDSAAKKNKPIQGAVKKFIDEVSSFLGAMENQEMPE